MLHWLKGCFVLITLSVGFLVSCLKEQNLFRISQKPGHCCWLFLSCAYHTNWGHHSESNAWNLIMQWKDIEPTSLSLENHGWDLRRSWRNYQRTVQNTLQFSRTYMQNENTITKLSRKALHHLWQAKGGFSVSDTFVRHNKKKNTLACELYIFVLLWRNWGLLWKYMYWKRN